MSALLAYLRVRASGVDHISRRLLASATVEVREVQSVGNNTTTYGTAFWCENRFIVCWPALYMAAADASLAMATLVWDNCHIEFTADPWSKCQRLWCGIFEADGRTPR